jgi:hypothetical protein
MHEVTAAAEKRGADPLAQLTIREAQAILDEELDNLPEKFRAPLLLFYLEGKTRDEAARQLGWSAKLVKSRLEQGRGRRYPHAILSESWMGQPRPEARKDRGQGRYTPGPRSSSNALPAARGSALVTVKDLPQVQV